MRSGYTLRAGIVLLLSLVVACDDDSNNPSNKPGLELIFERGDDITDSRLIRLDLGSLKETPLLPGVAARDANVSPDGQTVIFTRNEGDIRFNVWLAEITGFGLRRLTPESDYFDAGARWSPDGTRIAFWSDREGPGDIYVINADGTGLTQITEDPIPGTWMERSPTWMPDGGTLVISADYDGYAALWKLGTTPGNVPVRLIPEVTGSHALPALSPDGEWIAYVLGNDLVVRNLVTGASLTIDVPGRALDPAWAPDGSRIAFASDAQLNWDIYSISRNGTGLQQHTSNPLLERHPVWREK